MTLGCVLLASGSARRFGANKLLAKVDGVSLIRRTMAALPAAHFARAAVCSCHPEVLALAKASGYLPLQNSHAAEGIAASVRLGLSAMEGLDGVLFSVCDQPWLSAGSVERLTGAFAAHPAHICALAWQGRRGNPVIFPRHYFPELAALSGDVGGGVVLRRHPDRLLLVEALSPRELDDVDTPADLDPAQPANPCF